MSASPPSNSPAGDCAHAIQRAYHRYQGEFEKITRRAQARFEERDWSGGQRDARQRLEIYGRIMTAIVSKLRTDLGSDLESPSIWKETKKAYLGLIDGTSDQDFAETFFNSLTRRIFTTVGVNPEIEFVRARPASFQEPGADWTRTFRRTGAIRETVAELLQSLPFQVPFHDLSRDAQRISSRIAWGRRRALARGKIDALEFIDSVFYRGSRAFLVGRILGGGTVTPLLIALRNHEQGLETDAVLLTEDEISVVFSFARSYFHVVIREPWSVVRFLRTLMPKKPFADLYISLGYNKHGKTEMYRDLLRQLEESKEPFVKAPGDRGMVMIVFTLPTYDYVFKIIRDRFDYPKNSTPEEVIQRYQLVFQHDRAGRLVDAQEFEHLEFDRARFSEDLLAELQQSGANNVTIDEHTVKLHHVYLERRVVPLNLYLRSASEPSRLDVVLDFGQAIRDLAATNIFPGDLLLKNFGVTRHGRVIFYDYDELCLLTDCQFRDLPAARSHEEEVGAEPWYYVDEHDVFPEEFMQFLGLQGESLELFLEAHRDLLTAAYWRNLRQRHLEGEVIDVCPYAPSRRLMF